MAMVKMSDRELVGRLKQLACAERVLLGEVLRLLREVEERGIHLEYGFPSLYDFAMKELAFSEWEAHVRIQAVRLTQSVPEVEEFLENGRINLSVVAQAQTCFRREEKKKMPVPKEKQREIVSSLCGATKRQAEKKLADLFPVQLSTEKTKHYGNGLVKVEFFIEEFVWDRVQILFSVRSHTNLEKRWDKLFTDLVKLGWKKWYPGAKQSPWPANEQTRHQ